MSPHRDVAIVGGLRTPFAKRMTALSSLAAHDLGALACGELLERLDLDPAEVERLVFGRVVPDPDVHNPAREIVLRIGLPAGVVDLRRRGGGLGLCSACAAGAMGAAAIVEAA